MKQLGKPLSAELSPKGVQVDIGADFFKIRHASSPDIEVLRGCQKLLTARLNRAFETRPLPCAGDPRCLRENKSSAKEIAFALGYKHFNDFSRAYKKHYGHPPMQARVCGQTE